jgi:FkbM family methyltransferase
MSGIVERETSPADGPRRCWCGNQSLAPYADRYLLCRECGTLVSTGGAGRDGERVRDEDRDLYGLNYFVDHARALGHPDLVERSRLDLSERCVFWLEALLRRRPPPARTLELGCGNGSFVALLASAGYDATGLDLSPAVTACAREIFGIEVLTGPLGDHDLPRGTLDVLVMMDVVEHLADPVATLTTAATLVKEDGLLLVQTPRFDPALSFEEMERARALFLEQLKPEEHLFLFGPGSATAMLSRAGFGHVVFEPAIFSDYDMFLVASPSPIGVVPELEWRSSLRRSRSGRIVEALVDSVDLSRSLLPAKEEQALRARIAALENALADRDGHLARLERDRATFATRLRTVFRRAPRRDPDPPAQSVAVRPARDLGAALSQLAILKRVCRVDYEQVLAFQYAKILSPGDEIVDVGAHTGLHAARFVHLVGDAGAVLMVEPLPTMVERYLRPVYERRRGCRIFEGALSDRAGRSPFHVATGSEQESGLREKGRYAQATSGPGTVIDIDVSTLDLLARDRRIAFVKIDVEGAELRVLTGGKATLAASRPVVALESSRDSIEEFGDTPAALFDFAEEQGYVVATLFGTPLSRADFEAHASSGVVWDFFLLPRERSAGLCELLRRESSPYETDRFVDLRASNPGPHVEGLVGFSGLESWGRWTDARLAPVALVHLARPLPASFVLEIVAMGSSRPDTTFDVVVGDAVRTMKAPPDGMRTVSAPFTASGAPEVICVRPHATVSEAIATACGNARRLGVGIQSMRVLSASR